MTMLATAPQHLIAMAADEIAAACAQAPDYPAAVFAVACGWRDAAKAKGWPETSQVAAFAFVTEVGAHLAAAAILNPEG